MKCRSLSTGGRFGYAPDWRSASARARCRARSHHRTPAISAARSRSGSRSTSAFVLVEAVFGFLANSMALLADAGHNLSDVLGLVVAWAGAAMARRAPSPRFTYGLKKASILAALANALFLLIAVGAIGAEAIRRLFHPVADRRRHGDDRRRDRDRRQRRSPRCCSRAGAARYQHPRRLPAHGRRRRGFGGGRRSPAC